jgi:glycosyltransferase involved in cell wall biosynthesis
MTIPRISICTPTLHRRPFFPALIACIRAQDYPHELIEWVICEDGQDRIDDLLPPGSLGKISVVYKYVDKRMTLGEKRNYLYQLASGDILIHMDDDDYYPPTRVSHAVEVLQENPHLKLAGSNQMYFYSTWNQQVSLVGPFGINRANCATFAFRRELLLETSYDTSSCFGEEANFLKNYTLPIALLSPIKTILVICHSQNSCDKNEVLEGEHQPVQVFTKETTQTLLNDFFTHDDWIRQFYLWSVPSKLENFELGNLTHKPELLLAILKQKKRQIKLLTDFYQQKILTLETESTNKSRLISQLTIQLTQRNT